MILACHNISKAFVTHDILRDASFHIQEHEKAAVVGINGEGKSTLLKIIAGEMAPDSGQVTLARGARIGYLAQQNMLAGNRSIYDEVAEVMRGVIDMEQDLRWMERRMEELSGDALTELLDRYHQTQTRFEQMGGYAWKSEITGVLRGLGFTDEEFDKPVDTLSGGQKTRVALGKLLLASPDLCLLDEPTNHLDLNSIEWLENYLLNYRGAVIVVAHDRYFLNRIVSHVIEIDNAAVRSFTGDYNAYSEKKKLLRETQLRAWMNQQAEIRHQEEVIAKLRSFNREKSIKRAQSREHLLERMDRIEKPTEEKDDMTLRLVPNVQSGNDVLTISELSKGFDERTLFRDVNIEIKRGEHIAIIGDNGTGKTTLLRIIAGLERADNGTLTFGTNVYPAYFDQEHQTLHPEKTIFDEIQDEHPVMNNTEIRNMLAAFLFTGDDVYKLVGELSGGEQSRVSLAKLMLSDANLLILDEPTNHLDMTSREILENALIAYEGTVICVSHDRYFINRTADRILELYKGRFLNYIGSYDYYTEKCDLFHTLFTETPAYRKTVSAGSLDWKLKKEEDARKRKQENDLRRAEERVTKLEERISELDAVMADPGNATNAELLISLQADKTAAEQELDEAYGLWEALMSAQE